MSNKTIRAVAADILTNEDVALPALLYLLVQVSGEDWVENDPLLLYRELEEFTGIPQLDVDVENRIQALIVLMTSDLFYEEPLAFLSVVNTINNGDPDYDDMDPPTLQDVVWAIYETNMLDDNPPDFSDEVKALIKQIIRMEALDDDADPEEEERIAGMYTKSRAAALIGQLSRLSGKTLTVEQVLPAA